MRLIYATVVASLLTAPAWGQQAATPNRPAATSYVSAADIVALAAKLGNDKNAFQSIIRLAPYNVSIEHRVALQGASIHEREAELFYVIDGSGTVVTGGTLVDAKRTNPENLSGDRITGGTSQKVTKGDFVLVPEGVPHWFSEINGVLTLMSLHLPRPALAK